ncbi:FAD-binding oxidoreductase [Mesorhizobium sp. SB112]|uniref:FAD-binding oxidoreductase n=1 Tax=Mesorhizobium sp. SB112 TaxID=3151853 RepID=UPI0032633FE5
MKSLGKFEVLNAERYYDDFAGVRGHDPCVIYAPRNSEECAEILRTLSAARQACVVQGGRTGLAGGARTQKGEVVLSTERLRKSVEIDEKSGVMRVGAGNTLEEAQDAATEAGWMLGADLGARGSATIGGMIATNAGGPLAVRYGTFRQQVLGVEAVLADGTIIDRMTGLWKDNTGYNFPQILMGSEGTLGIITAAVLRLHAPMHQQVAALCTCEHIDAALEFLPRVKRRFGPLLQACEFMIAPLLEMSASCRAVEFPFANSASCYLLIEIGSSLEFDLQEVLYDTLSGGLEDGLLTDVIISQSEKDRLDFWQFREGCNEALDRQCAPLTSLDLSLPVSAIPEFLAKASAMVGPDKSAHAFGHLGDGNIHYIVSGPRQQDLVEPLFQLTRKLGGAISAEHGIGVDKARYLHICRSAEEIAAMRRIKDALDPYGILNPGRILQLPS